MNMTALDDFSITPGRKGSSIAATNSMHASRLPPLPSNPLLNTPPHSSIQLNPTSPANPRSQASFPSFTIKYLYAIHAASPPPKIAAYSPTPIAAPAPESFAPFVVLAGAEALGAGSPG